MSYYKYEQSQYSLYDLGGQQSIRTNWPAYFNKVSGIIWVIDSTDRRRMFETGLELATLLQNKQIEAVPILIFANKQDLNTALRSDEVFLFSNIRSRLNYH